MDYRTFKRLEDQAKRFEDTEKNHAPYLRNVNDGYVSVWTRNQARQPYMAPHWEGVPKEQLAGAFVRENREAAEKKGSGNFNIGDLVNALKESTIAGNAKTGK